MFYPQLEQLIIKGLVRVEGRPEGIIVIANTLKHRLMVKCLSRLDKLHLASVAAERRKAAKGSATVYPIGQKTKSYAPAGPVALRVGA